jgi:hypothetical protein
MENECHCYQGSSQTIHRMSKSYDLYENICCCKFNFDTLSYKFKETAWDFELIQK